MSNNIEQNLEKVLHRIESACSEADRDPDEVTLVAISKTKPVDDILEAFRAGQVHFGESRARELEEKMEAVGEDRIRWHMVGPLQTNKIKYMVDRVNWIDSIPKKKSLREIEKRASRIDRVINTLIQVNISGEDQKMGCQPDGLEPILEYAQGLEHVRVRGLMGIASLVDDPEDVRSEFRLLRELRDRYHSYNGGNIELEHLSMGMTNDLEVAVQEGSTMVRVGRAIFGGRN